MNAQRNFMCGCVALLSIADVACAQCPSATFAGLGVPPGHASTTAWSVSGDGRVVVGYTNLSAFRWNATGGIQLLNPAPGDARTAAYGVSMYGSTVVGTSLPSQGSLHAVRWDAAGNVTVLGSPETEAWAVSADGSTVVGVSHSSQEALVWNGLGQHAVGDCPPCLQSAQSVSEDGTVIVGSGGSQIPQGAWGWRRAASGIVQYLASDPVNGGSSYPLTVSADGQITVGMGVLGGSPAAFRPLYWKADGTVHDLGIPLAVLSTPNPRGQFARGVSADGSVISGSFHDGRAFVWTPALGPLDLETVLRVYGVNLDGWVLYESAAVSADGSVLAGTGAHTLANGSVRTEAWVASLPMLLTRRPISHEACYLSTDQLTVAATGTARPFTFAWRRNGIAIPASDGRYITTVSGDGRSNTLSILSVEAATAGVYDCVVASTLGSCGSMTTAAATISICPGDFNCDGNLQVSDIFAFLNAWFAASPRANINGGDLSVQDIFDFLNDWFAGCPL